VRIKREEKCEVIFLAEHWLYENERNLIQNDFRIYNILFNSDMELVDMNIEIKFSNEFLTIRLNIPCKFVF